MIERIIHNDQILAIIVRNTFNEPGIHFFTPDSFSQQLAYMKRPAGYKIKPHVHNQVQREVFQTQEILFVKKGRLKIDFYDIDKKCIDTKILEDGDTILLASGGHGVEMLDQTEIIEVKQGPYSGEQDKTRFEVAE